MNWFTNICSCISPHLKQNIINYLNSTSLNRQVIEQQKVTQQSRDGSQNHEPENHIYSFAKSKSVNFMKLDQDSDDDSEGEQKILKSNHSKTYQVKANSYNMSRNDEKDSEKQQVGDEIMDVFWYPKINKNQSKMQQFRSLLAHKRKIFDIILEQQASAAQYDKVYDSLDETNLTVHCKLQSLIKGKKINSYRFSFQIKGISIHEYSKWAKQVSPKQTLPLLQESSLIQSDPEDPSFSINHNYFKKLLVVNPQDLITVSKIFQIEQQQQKTLTTIIFSVDEQQNQIGKNKKEGYHRAWLYLCGIQALQIEGGVKISGYLCIELDVSVSPNMLKQPISKQIRVFAQKMICSIRKSDEI